MVVSEQGKKIRIHCGECKRDTNHTVIALRETYSDPNDDYVIGVRHCFCQCAGCDNYCYAIAELHGDDWDPDTNEFSSSWRTYPRSKGERLPIDGTHELPDKVETIYHEILGAINAQLPVLTAIGLRALIEAICKEQNIPADNLAKRIDGLATLKVLSQSQAKILHSLRFLGNGAAHEIELAKRTELVAALEIAEAMLRTIYVLPGLSNQIKTGNKSKQDA